MAKIALIRHGNKEGDALTLLGELQIRNISQILLDCGYSPDIILHSPTNRTRQCAQISKEVFGKAETPIQECSDLSPEAPIMQALGSEEAFVLEMRMILGNGGTVADALRLGKYPAAGQQQLRKFLLGQSSPFAICFSHAPYSTLGVTSDLPYCAPEASCAIYDVQNGVISLERFITL